MIGLLLAAQLATGQPVYDGCNWTTTNGSISTSTAMACTQTPPFNLTPFNLTNIPPSALSGRPVGKCSVPELTTLMREHLASEIVVTPQRWNVTTLEMRYTCEDIAGGDAVALAECDVRRAQYAMEQAKADKAKADARAAKHQRLLDMLSACEAVK